MFKSTSTTAGNVLTVTKLEIRSYEHKKVKKVKADIALRGNPISELREFTCHGITQCYLPNDTSKCAPPKPSHAGWYSIYLPRRDGRLS